MSSELEVRHREDWTGLTVEEHFLSDVLVRRLRYRNDQLVSDMPFGDHGFPVGVAREWYESGELKRVRTFTKHDAVTGELLTYYRNGQVKHRRHREARRWAGTDEKFWSDGAPRMVGRWDEGSRHKTWRWFHPNGQVRLEVPYDHDVIDGTFHVWRETGELIFEGVVRRGVIDRTCLEALEDYEELRQFDLPYTPEGIVIYDKVRIPVAHLRLTVLRRGWWRFSS